MKLLEVLRLLIAILVNQPARAIGSGFRSPPAGFAVIVFLWLAILATIFYSFMVSRRAGFLLLPYIGWVTFASVLNFSIYTLNKSKVRNHGVVKGCADVIRKSGADCPLNGIMRVFVTRGTGFVGRHVTRGLAVA